MTDNFPCVLFYLYFYISSVFEIVVVLKKIKLWPIRCFPDGTGQIKSDGFFCIHKSINVIFFSFFN